MSSQTEVEAWSSAQLGRKLSESNPDKLKAIREAGLLPEKISDILSQIENDYDPEYGSGNDPSRAEYTDRYQKVVFRWTSKCISKAVMNGHDRYINRFIEVVEEETSIDNIDVFLRFSKWVIREAGVTYLAGHMGTGKTDMALLMAEVFHKELKESDKNVLIASNIKSTAQEHEFIEFIDSQPDLKEWLESNDGYKFFIFDESSSHASGYSGDSAKVTKQFRSMIRLIRKHDGSIVCIGHDGKDLHPTVRELADFVEKKSKKEAVVFEDVNDREGENKKFKLEEIPQTNLYYNTKEASSWEWASQTQESNRRDEIIGEIYVNEDITQSKIGEYFDISQAKVSECVRKYRENQD